MFWKLRAADRQPPARCEARASFLLVERLIKRFGPMVYRRALAILGDAEEARDAMQEVFIKLLRAGYRSGDPEPASSFLYRITTNTCLNQLRAARRRRAAVERSLGAKPEESEPTAERLFLMRELLAEVDEQLAAAAIYVHLEGMSHEEVASLLGVSRRTVGNLLSRFERAVKDRNEENEL